MHGLIDKSLSYLKLYNMFPLYPYGMSSPKLGIDDMIGYLPKIAEMGFNAVWVNPLQLTGDISQEHPGHHHLVHGSLYAMADIDHFHPLVFPHMDVDEAEEKLRQWTTAAAKLGLRPIFDLVLNHIGANQTELTPLMSRLDTSFISDAPHPRWPDIKTLNYYVALSKNKGINTKFIDLDLDKIDMIFEQLWTPYITRYIRDYGFSGVRIDALVHLPLYVQNKAYQLIEELVQRYHGQSAIIIGELMSGQFSQFAESLPLARLTHCMNPHSFFWQSGNESMSLLQHSWLELHAILTDRTYDLHLELIGQPFNQKRHTVDKTLYLNYATAVPELVLYYSKFLPAIALTLSESPSSMQVIRYLAEYSSSDRAQKQRIKVQIHNLLLQDGMIQHQIDRLFCSPLQMAVLGNHDLGRLASKTLLDLAYHHQFCIESDETKEVIKKNYQLFKQTALKSSRTLEELKAHLVTLLGLEESSFVGLYTKLKSALQARIFIQALVFGNYYILSGDEFAAIRKPDVFFEYGLEMQKMGTSMMKDLCMDLSVFFASINHMLTILSLPQGGKIANIAMTIDDKLINVTVVGKFLEQSLSYHVFLFTEASQDRSQQHQLFNLYIQQTAQKLPNFYPIHLYSLDNTGEWRQHQFYFQAASPRFFKASSRRLAELNLDSLTFSPSNS